MRIMLAVCAVLAASLACTPAPAKLEENSQLSVQVDTLSPAFGSGHGTGVVVSSCGHVVTVRHIYHVVDKVVLMENGRPTTYPVEKVDFDLNHDIGIVKINRRFRQHVLLADFQKDVRPGAAVYSVGYPALEGRTTSYGQIVRLNFSPSAGVIALEPDMIIADVPGLPGASGAGVFLSDSGRLAGILIGRTLADSEGSTPKTFLVSVEYVRQLLQQNGIGLTVCPD